jgi:hypothetical protein
VKVVFLAAGLMLSPVVFAQERQAAGDKATVVIYKGHHVATLWRAAFAVYVNDRMIVRLDRGRYCVAKLAPGTYLFRTKHKNQGAVELDARAGQTYYLRMDTDSGVQVTNARLRIETPEQARGDLRMMKPIEQGDIKDRSVVLWPVPGPPASEEVLRPARAPQSTQAQPVAAPVPQSQPQAKRICSQNGYRVPCPEDKP